MENFVFDTLFLILILFSWFTSEIAYKQNIRWLKTQKRMVRKIQFLKEINQKDLDFAITNKKTWLFFYRSIIFTIILISFVKIMQDFKLDVDSFISILFGMTFILFNRQIARLNILWSEAFMNQKYSPLMRRLTPYAFLIAGILMLALDITRLFR